MGRATSVILPSGESLQLTSKMGDTDGLEVSISEPPTRLRITGKANKKVVLIDSKFFELGCTNTNDQTSFSHLNFFYGY